MTKINYGQLQDCLCDLFESDLQLMKRKNADYTNQDDALENLREFGLLGIVVRLNDKFSRLKNLIVNDKEPSVEDEKIEDTLRDISNYCYLARVMKKENVHG